MNTQPTSNPEAPTTVGDTTGDVFASIWDVAHDHIGLDEECSPTKPCRNMRDVTFDGFGEPGTDPAKAWRDRLAREGKLDPDAGSVRDLVRGERP